MAWKPKQPKWDWRKFLTVEEKQELEVADRARATWLALNKNRAGIQNRAIQRAKYAAGATK